MGELGSGWSCGLPFPKTDRDDGKARYLRDDGRYGRC